MMARDVKGRSRHFLLRNVRCVPQFGCTLVSVDQLWAESGTDCVFRDTRLIVPKSGPAIPFTHRDGFYILEATVVTHSLAASDTPGAPARVRSLVCRPHSSKSSSFLANLPPDQAAELLHRRYHIGAERLRRLPRYSADIPDNVSRAAPSTCKHCVEANATHLSHTSTQYEPSHPGRLVHTDT